MYRYYSELFVTRFETAIVPHKICVISFTVKVMERRSRETPFEHAIKQEGKYDSLEQVVNPRINFAEHSSQQNFSVAKAKSMDDSNVTRGAAYNSSRPENVTEYAKRKGLDPELVKSHSFLMVLASARKIYSAVADLRTQNKALDSRLCRHLVWGIWTEALRKQDFDSDSFIEDTFTTFGLGAEHLATFQVFFANLIRSVRTAYSRSPPEQAVHSNLARIVATIFPNVDEGMQKYSSFFVETESYYFCLVYC